MTAALLDYAAAATAAVTSPRSACQQHCLTMLQQQLPRYFPMDCQPAALLAFAAAATTVILPHGLLASSIACLCCSSNYRDTSPRSATSSIAYLSCSSNCSVTSPRSAFQQYCLPMLQRENQPQLHTYLRARNQPQQKRQRICPRLLQQHACDFGVRSPGSTTLGTSASMLQDANQQQGEIHAFSAAASSLQKARNVCWVSRVVEKMGYLPLDLLVLIRLTDPRYFFTGSDPGQVSSFLSLFSMTNDSWIIFVFTERQKHETFNYLEEKILICF